jgi:hypothetical protein
MQPAPRGVPSALDSVRGLVPQADERLDVTLPVAHGHHLAVLGRGK